MSTDNNEWITVTKASKKRIFRHSSRGGRRNNNNVPTPPPPTTSLAASSLLLFDNKNELSVEEITKCLDEQLILEEIPKSKFFQSFKSNIVDATANTNTNTNINCRGRSSRRIITKIICYGIGNFSKQSASQWQIACAIALWRILIQEQQQQSTTITKTETTNNNNSSTDEKDNTTTNNAATTTKSTTISMEYYDPCMTQNEIIYLERNGINVLSLNERGKKSIDNDNDNNNEITLFFMPHCPLSLYTNVLYTNWECLHRVIIFGNSMSAYAHRLLNQNKHVRLLRLLESRWIEVPMPIETSDIVHRSGNFEQAFNDSSVTYFKTVVGNAIDNKTDTPLPERPSFFEITTDSDEDEVI